MKSVFQIPTMPLAEYRQLVANNKEHVLIDVREKDEWNAGHIEHAIHVPLKILEFKIQDHVPNKETTIVVHCLTGIRSSQACSILQKLGYKNSFSLEGGYAAYTNN